MASVRARKLLGGCAICPRQDVTTEKHRYEELMGSDGRVSPVTNLSGDKCSVLFMYFTVTKVKGEVTVTSILYYTSLRETNGHASTQIIRRTNTKMKRCWRKRYIRRRHSSVCSWSCVASAMRVCSHPCLLRHPHRRRSREENDYDAESRLQTFVPVLH